ncbi:hypothetical protein [Xylophilus sp. GOD-11R]|uniref:hypothetical protein n=1 Tax=Xylophilus sp. GOD-11R TaxID=3089814 RepID=UPI00298C9871|nr:hypothetical protein [Xylophilus sp. GOD-11R]WPB56670.1 hypothetical protein R9X41_21415 [Xylophilus sp. GOD-11R]
MKRIATCAATALAVVVLYAAPVADRPDVAAARAAYWQCATLAVPDVIARMTDPRLAAIAAVDRCQTEHLALAGHYALGHPGARDVGTFAAEARKRLIDDIARWMTDLETMVVERGE